MSVSSPQEITQLLVAWNKGDLKALEQLTPLIHTELHRLAKRHMAGERPGHILQTTALVNEAYLRLINWRNVEWRDRAHFFGLAAQIMRRILVDFARARRREKRGGEALRVPLSEADKVGYERNADLVALDDALQALEKLNRTTQDWDTVQYRARKQAVDRVMRRLLTRAVLYQSYVA
ncbi:MAG TPA: ECF-type sigma factor [Blastocatellia bacterium]